VQHPHGQVMTEVMDDRILVRQVDRAEKKSALTPKVARELAAGPARLDEDPDRFAGLLTFAGDHRTARLEVPLFFGRAARSAGR
jgi:enoyl-CoA hydratase/carnithine racemase